MAGILDQTSSGLDEESRLKAHHAQIRAELKAQEDATNKAYAEYTIVAGKLDKMWKANAEIVMFGDRAVRSIPKESKFFPDFQKLQLQKEEARVAWQREANKHGRYILAAEKAMNVPPPGFMGAGST